MNEIINMWMHYNYVINSSKQYNIRETTKKTLVLT